MDVISDPKPQIWADQVLKYVNASLPLTSSKRTLKSKQLNIDRYNYNCFLHWLTRLLAKMIGLIKFKIFLFTSYGVSLALWIKCAQIKLIWHPAKCWIYPSVRFILLKADFARRRLSFTIFIYILIFCSTITKLSEFSNNSQTNS
jgi:hypothetical protein